MIESFTILSGVVALLSIYKKLSNKLILFWLIVLPIAVLDGLRWEMGTDWVSYYEFWIGMDHGMRGTAFDPGWVLYTDIINTFTDNYSVYLLSISLITYCGTFYAVFLIT